MNVERCVTHENIGCPICEDKAEIERLRAELAEFQRIRELLTKSLMRATDYGRERIEEGPLTAAVAHAKSVAECREALHVIKAIVCGEAMPRWENTPRTGVSRSRIADICDAALAADGEGT